MRVRESGILEICIHKAQQPDSANMGDVLPILFVLLISRKTITGL